MRTLHIDKEAGQFTYRITEDGTERVSKQFGTFDDQTTIEQASRRFGHVDKIVREDKREALEFVTPEEERAEQNRAEYQQMMRNK